VRIRLDGVIVSMDTIDPANARARAKCLAGLPVEHHAAADRALITLADRIGETSARQDTAQSSVTIAPVEPWPEPVCVESVLNALVERIARHVRLPPHGAAVVAVWIVLTYLLEVLPVAPILWVYSPTRGCGKSVLLDLVALLAARALKSENATVSALFRIAEKDRATLILDEIDQWLIGDRHGEVSGLLNASFTKGGRFLRTVGEDFEPKAFDVFSFRAVAGIGATLHDTTKSRAYRIAMTRAPAGALPPPLQTMYADPWAVPLRQQVARAAHQLRDGIAARLEDPHATEYPPHLDGRARDLWLPLLALGAEIGEPWSSQLTDACVAMSRAAAADVVDVGELLLLDCRRFFAERDGKPTEPADLLAWLLNQEASQWPEYRKGHPLTSRGLATLLARFKINSEPGWVDGKKARWLHAEQFADAWRSYLPEIEKGGPYQEISATVRGLHSMTCHSDTMTERKSSWTRTTSTSPTREKSGGRVIQGQVWSACRYRRRRDGGGNIKREVRTMSEKQRDKQRWSPRFRARTADG
jgi:hypothetical protein